MSSLAHQSGGHVLPLERAAAKTKSLELLSFSGSLSLISHNFNEFQQFLLAVSQVFANPGGLEQATATVVLQRLTWIGWPVNVQP